MLNGVNELEGTLSIKREVQSLFVSKYPEVDVSRLLGDLLEEAGHTLTDFQVKI